MSELSSLYYCLNYGQLSPLCTALSNYRLAGEPTRGQHRTDTNKHLQRSHAQLYMKFHIYLPIFPRYGSISSKFRVYSAVSSKKTKLYMKFRVC